MRVHRAILVSAAAILLIGCTVGPRCKRPAVAVPAQWSLIPGHGLSAQTNSIESWWTQFGDPTLDNLIHCAASSNLDLLQAADRVNEARASAGIVRSDFFLRIGSTAAASRNRVRVVAAQGRTSYAFVPIELSNFQGRFDASWELDVFGRIRSEYRAAKGDAAAAEEDRSAVFVTVVADVARYYADLRGAQLRLSLAQQNITTDTDILSLTRVRTAAGLATETDVARASAQLESVAAQVPSLEAAIALNIYRLGVLLGEQPLVLEQELAAVKPLPSPPPLLFAGLPSDLIEQRPDIRQSEAKLYAQNARIGAAKADYFPRFMLTGGAGRETAVLHDITLGAANLFSAGPSVSLPIFTAGRIRSNVALQQARANEASNAYRSTLLRAFEETQGALTRYAKDQNRLEHLRRAVAGEQDALALSQVQYRAGLADFLAVRDAERELYTRQDEEAQSSTALVTDAIAVYKALGGSYKTQP